MKTLTRFSQIKPSASLAWLAGGSGLIYALAFTLPFSLPRLYAVIPPVDYAKLTGHSPGGLLTYVLAIAALFGLYLGAIKLTAPGSGQPPVVGSRFILTGSAMLAAVSIPAYPLTAIDLFIYAIRSRGWALYGLNPLAAAPERFPPADPWLGLAGEWIDAPSPYGPVWEWLSLAAFHVGGGNFFLHLLALKIAAALAYLGCVWLIYRILSRLSPPWAAAGTIAFAWNPLVLLESVQNGHNDILMVFFFLAALWLLIEPGESTNKRISESASQPRGVASPLARASFAHSPIRYLLVRPSLVCFLLALSVLVKFITVLAAPFLVLAMAATQPTWPRRTTAAVLYGLLIAAPVAGLMWPLWPGWDNWAVLTAGSGAGRSLLALLVLALRGAVGVNLAFNIARGLVNGGFALIYLYFLRQTFAALCSGPPVSLVQPIRAAFYTLFWYVLLAAPVFHAWYLLWFIPPAVLLLPERRAFSAAVVFSFTALLAIPYFETVRVWFPVLLQNHLLGHLIGVPLLLVPPALALQQSISSKLIFEV